MTDPATLLTLADRLSQSQKKALIWLAENDHWRSAWTVQRRAVTQQHPELWSHLRVSGKKQILIEKSDMAALKDFIVAECSNNRLWVLTPIGQKVYETLRELSQ
jgi:hypothetical protein